MRLLHTFLLCTVFIVPLWVQAALSEGSSSASGAQAKVCYKGDASTYNPNLPGFKTGGQQTATGERYNPNAWEAALQLNLAKQHSCGYGAGKTCFAAVESADGKTLILKINDNGPLCSDPAARCSGRIIDLNEASMRFLSGGKYGNNSGILKGVSVCLLDGKQMALGPINEADRNAWAQKLANTPFSQPVMNQQNPSGSSGPYQLPTGECMVSTSPIFVTQGPCPQQAQASQFPNYQQSGTTQPGQYFNDTYKSVPSNQPFPLTTPTNNAQNNTMSEGTTGTNPFRSSLMNLIKPFVNLPSTSTPTITITPITSSSTGSIIPQNPAQVSVSVLPIATTSIASYNPPQTFVQQYMPQERPSAVSISPASSTVSFAMILSTLKSALLRLAELLRLL